MYGPLSALKAYVLGLNIATQELLTQFSKSIVRRVYSLEKTRIGEFPTPSRNIFSSVVNIRSDNGGRSNYILFL